MGLKIDEYQSFTYQLCLPTLLFLISDRKCIHHATMTKNRNTKVCTKSHGTALVKATIAVVMNFAKI